MEEYEGVSFKEALADIVSRLKKPERAFIEDAEKDLLKNLKIWAQLIDEIDANVEILGTLPDQERAKFTTARDQFGEILANIKGFEITPSSNSYSSRYTVDSITQQISNYRAQRYLELINIKTLILTINANSQTPENLRKLVNQARREAENFEASFTKSLERQASGSQKVLAQHFDTKAGREEKTKKHIFTKTARFGQNKVTHSWLVKRRWALAGLFLGIVILIAVYIWIITSWREYLDGLLLQIFITKAAVIALLYTIYHFATKNYYISANLQAKYEHRAIIAKTLTDFTGSSIDNKELREAIYKAASDTIFSDIDTGYVKAITEQQTSTPISIDNIIPKP